MLRALVDALACPHDGAGLLPDGAYVRCALCATRYAFEDGVLLLDGASPDARDRAERSSRDRESPWYDTMFEGYTNAVELPTVVRRIGPPRGAVLDHGAGTGRVSEALARRGHLVVAVDYSRASLARLVRRVGDLPVIAVQADVRRLPLRSGAVSAATSVEIYEHVRGRATRLRVLDELARVLAPGGPLVLTAFNYNVLFRIWRARGNAGAREGEHLLGGDFYYRRFTRAEFRAEVQSVFAIDKLVGIRNIPARSLARALTRVAGSRTGDAFLRAMTTYGWRLDVGLERTPLAAWFGLFWLARAHAPLRRTVSPPVTFTARSRVDRLLRERRAPT